MGKSTNEITHFPVRFFYVYQAGVNLEASQQPQGARIWNRHAFTDILLACRKLARDRPAPRGKTEVDGRAAPVGLQT